MDYTARRREDLAQRDIAHAGMVGGIIQAPIEDAAGSAADAGCDHGVPARVAPRREFDRIGRPEERDRGV